MAISDPIADMLTRIRNAAKAKFKSVDIPGSNLKCEIARVLKEQGYIRNYKFTKDNRQGVLRIYLKYDQDENSSIYEIKRISKPSRRVFTNARDLKPVYNGLGIAILSTSKGLMTDRNAIQDNIGGEILCHVW